MIAVLSLVFFAVLAVVALLLLARGRAASVNAVGQLGGRTRPIDIAAFRNLVAPTEEQYLRQRLPKREFRKIHAERMKAAIGYLQRVGDNAAVLLRLGESARRSENLEVAKAGAELVNTALNVRLLVLLGQAKLCANMLLPGLHFSPERLTSSYESLTGTVVRLGRLQNYADAGRIGTSL
jgi:hypothetical protein